MSEWKHSLWLEFDARESGYTPTSEGKKKNLESIKNRKQKSTITILICIRFIEIRNFFFLEHVSKILLNLLMREPK